MLKTGVVSARTATSARNNPIGTCPTKQSASGVSHAHHQGRSTFVADVARARTATNARNIPIGTCPTKQSESGASHAHHRGLWTFTASVAPLTGATFMSARNKYDGLCLMHFIHAHPDRALVSVRKNFHTKELNVFAFLKQSFGNRCTIHFNQTPPGSCSRRKVDAVIDVGYCVLAIEIDELAARDLQGRM